MNGLMVAFAFGLPYHVLRTAAAAGVRVHVLGSGPSRGLRASRFCASYRTSAAGGNGEQDHEIVLGEVEEIVRRGGIDVVFPSDDVSTRLLAAVRHRLPVRSSPLPDLATFDLLNDKWNFTRFALAHGVRVPQGWSYDEPGELKRDLKSGALELPVTVKPTNQSGSRGVIHIRNRGEIAQLDEIDYRPILVQRHIVGETIGVSAICRDGRILVHATQRRDDYRFQLFANPDLIGNVARLAAATGLNGPANFDAVLEDKSGLAYIVECNPRFWFTIYMSMIVGLNFFDCALRDPAESVREPMSRDHGEIKLSLKRLLAMPWQASAQDWAHAAYTLGDPLVYFLQRRKFYDDRRVAVEASQMQPYQPPVLEMEPRRAVNA
jgi:glutathione synthase/RimK-type ligase-like ATP-grasp enzyme